MFDGVIEVRASAGDNRLGGDDFNDCLIDLARPALDPDGLLGKLPADRSAALLAQAAERCRGSVETMEIPVPGTAQRQRVTISLGVASARLAHADDVDALVAELRTHTDVVVPTAEARA